MKRFGHVVCNHIPSWAPDYGHFALCDTISNKEVPYIYMLRALAAQSFPIIFQNNRGLVVLVKIIFLDILTLRLKEILCPSYCWHEVVDSYYLIFRRTSTVVGPAMGNPRPLYIPSPECPCMLGWSTKDLSTHHFKIPLPLELRIRGSVRILVRYCISHTKLSQSSSLSFRTLIVKNDMDVQVSGRAYLVA